MTQTLIAGLANAGVGTGATNYASIGTGRLTTSSAVANYKTTWRTAGTFSNLYCRITANAASTSNSNINYFVGAGVGNQSVVITKSVTGEFTDTTDNDVAAAGNVIAYQIVNGGGGTLSVQTITELFSPTTAGNSVNKLTCTGALTDTSINTNYYNPLAGQLNNSAGNTVQANAQFTNKNNATLDNLYVLVSANTASVATVKSQIAANTAGNLSVTITSGGTGAFEDTSDNDAITPGELVNTILNSTVTSTFTIRVIAVDYLTSRAQTIFMAADPNGTAIATSATRYMSIGGATTLWDATQLDMEIKTQVGFTASNLQAYAITNTITANSTVTFQVGGSAGNQVVTFGSGVTGYLEDTTDSDAITSTSEVNYRLLPGASGTSIAISNVGILARYILATEQDELWFGMNF